MYCNISFHCYPGGYIYTHTRRHTKHTLTHDLIKINQTLISQTLMLISCNHIKMTRWRLFIYLNSPNILKSIKILKYMNIRTCTSGFKSQHITISKRFFLNQSPRVIGLILTHIQYFTLPTCKTITIYMEPKE
nr:hypothetical protein Itr_chr09CG06400 [Ipomoea trifida]